MRYWLNSPDDPQEIAERSANVCAVYREAQVLDKQGVRVVSVDEKTGIQAIERIAPEKPVQPGHAARIEFNYRRHGTRCLIASFAVARGDVPTASIGPTRTEADFAAHIERTTATDPSATGWIFVADQLNTHMSETLVRLVARMRGVDETTLGAKGTHGILKSRGSRRTFLESASEAIRFVYTPRHASWLNQIEIWFSVLVRKLLKRASFASLTELEDRLRRFVEYFNRTMAKPYRWTCEGKPLRS